MDIKTIAYRISDVSDFSEFLPLLAFLLAGKAANQYKLLGIFFSISSLLKSMTYITAEKDINNMPIFHLLAPLEITFLFLFYDKVMLRKGYRLGWLLLILAFNLADSLLFSGIYQFNSRSWALNSLILIILGLLYFYYLYKDFEGIQIERFPNFYINSGFLIYAACAFFTYLLGWNILSGKPEGFFHNAWIIQCLANITKNGIVAYGLWITKQG